MLYIYIYIYIYIKIYMLLYAIRYMAAVSLVTMERSCHISSTSMHAV